MSNSEKALEKQEIDYLGILLSRWKLIILGTFLCAVAAAGVSLLLPNQYEASSMLVVTPAQFKTELMPGIFPAETYKRILLSKTLLSQVLEEMKKKYPEDFNKVAVEDILADCKVDLEIPRKDTSKGESNLLILSVRHTNPAFAMEISNTWATKFMALNKNLNRGRITETDRFISRQFAEAEKKLTQAEKDVTDFKDTAQMEALRQQIATMTEQAKFLFGEFESKEEELVVEKRKLATLEEQISAVEINGRWLGELPESEIDLSKKNEFQKAIASELLKIAKLYQDSTEKLASLAETADVETLRKRLSSYRSMLVEKDSSLETIQARRKSLEAALNAISKELNTTEKVFILKKSLPEEVVWEETLKDPTKQRAEKIAGMHLKSEVLNPNYIQLTNQINILREELEKAMSEEKHITVKIPQLEEVVKKLESKLGIQEKKRSDLETRRKKAKTSYETRYADYISWLDERNNCRIIIAELEQMVTLLEERHNKRLAQMRSMITKLNEKQDGLDQLSRGIEVAKHAYGLFKNKVEEARIITAQETEDVRIVSSAMKPDKKVSPQRSLITIASAVIGFLIASLIIVLSEYRRQVA